VDDRISRRTLIGSLALGAVGLPFCRSAHPAPRSGREGATRTVDFLDERWISHTHALTRQVARPERVSDEPVIAPAGAHGTTLPNGDGLCMWYSTVRWVEIGGQKTHETWIHYATSEDGVTFEKPDLGLHEGNVIIKADDTGADGKPLTGVRGCSGFCVLDAQQQPVPHARGRYTAMFRAWVPGRHGGLSLAYSDDGLRWTAYEENPVRVGSSDTFNIFCYDDRIERYVAYVRPLIHAGPPRVNRLVARIESEDLVHWENEQIVLDTDDRDAPALGTVNEATHPDGTGYPRGRDKQFYGLTVTPHQEVYLGFASLYDVVPGTMWVELMHSYDGIQWRREPQRGPLIGLGGDDAWDSGLVYFPNAGCPVAVGDDWLIYYAGTNFDHHHRTRSRGDLGEFRATGAVRLKRGRLVGYEAGDVPGDLLTRTFPWNGNELFLNADAHGGSIAVEICAANGQSIRGFSRKETASVTEDGVRVPVAFEAGGSLASLQGRQVRLRMYLKRASVFGISLG